MSEPQLTCHAHNRKPEDCYFGCQPCINKGPTTLAPIKELPIADITAGNAEQWAKKIREDFQYAYKAGDTVYLTCLQGQSKNEKPFKEFD